MNDLLDVIEALTVEERDQLKALATKIASITYCYYVLLPDGSYLPPVDQPGFEFKELAELSARQRAGVVERIRHA